MNRFEVQFAVMCGLATAWVTVGVRASTWSEAIDIARADLCLDAVRYTRCRVYEVRS